MKSFFRSVCCLLGIVCTLGVATAQDAKPLVRWFDNQTRPQPQGALLTNNANYWGESVLTNIKYEYSQPPNAPTDILGSDKTKFGNRLLDGFFEGNWTATVGIDNQPLVVVFDFGQVVTLSEVAVAEYRKQALRLAQVEVKSDEHSAWEQVFSNASPAGGVHRLPLPRAVSARWVRLQLQSVAKSTYISEVWMWGAARPSATQVAPSGIFSEMRNFPETKAALPGDGTVLSPQDFSVWRRATGYHRNDVTWLVASDWQTQKRNALTGNFLPGKKAIRQPLEIKATRYEKESAALFLLNTMAQPQKRTVELSAFRDERGRVANGITGSVRVAGAIWTRRWGQTLRPLFAADNKLGSSLMEKYLTNAGVIKDFPTLNLPPRGTALLWLTVEVEGAVPGSYQATLSDGHNKIPVHVEVLPLHLPEPDVWVRFWRNAPTTATQMWSGDGAMAREMEYQRSIGASVWKSWPDKESYADVARRPGKPSHYVIGISNAIRDAGYKSQLDPDKFTDAFKKKVQDEVSEMVKTAQKLGLSYKDWSIELWDEPTVHNMKSWVAIARLIKAADPQIQMYINPLFWTREGTNPGFVSDARQTQMLGDWYNELVDISVPIMGQVNARRYPDVNKQYYDHLPRAVRAFFIHPNPGRMLAWEALLRDYNGWGAYAYHAPRRDPWNDFDHREFDYQIVYPGPYGFIPTIESEAMRESWDDYRLLSLLKQQGKTRVLNEVLNAYRSGVLDIPAEETAIDRDRRSLQAERILPALREKMLRALGN